jgi:hypothetical protein
MTDDRKPIRMYRVITSDADPRPVEEQAAAQLLVAGMPASEVAERLRSDGYPEQEIARIVDAYEAGP